MNEPSEKLQAIFDAIDDFLFVLDYEGHILDVNPITTKRLGYPREELIGKSVMLVHPPGWHE